MDEVYTNIAEVVTPEWIFAADLQIHQVRFPEYMHKWKKVKQKETSQSKDIRFLFRFLVEIFSSGMRKQ